MIGPSVSGRDSLCPPCGLVPVTDTRICRAVDSRGLLETFYHSSLIDAHKAEWGLFPRDGPVPTFLGAAAGDVAVYQCRVGG